MTRCISRGRFLIEKGRLIHRQIRYMNENNDCYDVTMLNLYMTTKKSGRGRANTKLSLLNILVVTAQNF